MTDTELLREALKALRGLLDHIEQLERGHSPWLLSQNRIPQASAIAAKLEERLLQE